MRAILRALFSASIRPRSTPSEKLSGSFGFLVVLRFAFADGVAADFRLGRFLAIIYSSHLIRPHGGSFVIFCHLSARAGPHLVGILLRKRNAAKPFQPPGQQSVAWKDNPHIGELSCGNWDARHLWSHYYIVAFPC
jgi:hypothetical protein